jgi:methylated-DNA-[protein]-cysteine S-methyltransferase
VSQNQKQEFAMLTLLQDKIATPLGPLWVLCDEAFRLRAVEWEEHEDRMEQLLDIHYRQEGYQRVDSRNPGSLCARLNDYFDGDLGAIDALPGATAGTPFQREVWQALRTIPCGQTINYGQLAQMLGRPGAARAVGAANGANPISIVVPCHRVIGRDGTLTGYAGGVQRKEWLLRHEGWLLL